MARFQLGHLEQFLNRFSNKSPIKNALRHKISHGPRSWRRRMKFKFSNHALEEIERRKISISLVEMVLENPQQMLKQDEEIIIYQSQLDFGTGKQIGRASCRERV